MAKTQLDAAILGRSTGFVEYPPQTRIEGELQQVDATFPVTEIWTVLAGQVQGRTPSDQVTGTPFAQELDLVADSDDPKDLFGFANSPVFTG